MLLKGRWYRCSLPTCLSIEAGGVSILLPDAHFALAMGRIFQKHHRNDVQRSILVDPAKEKCMKLANYRSAGKAKELLESMCQITQTRGTTKTLPHIKS